MKKNNPFGYKVGYRENGNRLFIRHFMTYTYKQACFSLRFYRKYPQRNRKTNRPIIDPFWEIKPITKKEYLAGIWDELPFKRMLNCKISCRIDKRGYLSSPLCWWYGIRPKIRPRRNAHLLHPR